MGNSTSFRRRIWTSMIALTAVCGLFVLVASIVLYRNEINNNLDTKIGVAVNVVQQTINDFKTNVHTIAFGLSNNPIILNAIENGDRDSLVDILDFLLEQADIDKGLIIDKDGYVIASLHAPEMYGDYKMWQSHVSAAFDGRIETYITQGADVSLHVAAGAPIFDENGNILGVVTVGHRLDEDAFIQSMRRLTGAEISFFVGDIRIATTLVGDEKNVFALGERVNAEISSIVLAGHSITETILVEGRQALGKYVPMFSKYNSNEVVGMMFIGYETTEEIRKIYNFILIGLGITILVILVCFAIARIISKDIDNRMFEMMDEIRRAKDILEESNWEMGMQTVMLSTLVNTIPDIIFAKDRDLKFTHFNKAFLNHHGVDKSIKGKGDVDGLGIPPEMAEKFNEYDLAVINNNEIMINEEIVPGQNGTVIYCETIKAPLVIHGQSIGVLGISRDITSRKEEEKQLADSIKYASLLSDSLSNITKSSEAFKGDIKAAADMIIKEACLTLKASNVGVWKHSDDGLKLINISFYDDVTHKHSVVKDYDLSPYEEYSGTLMSDRLIIINNVQEDEVESSNEYATGICSFLEAPIRVDGKVFGIVSIEQKICDKYPSSRNWEIGEQNYASSLADLMALAILGSERKKAQEIAESASKAKSEFLASMTHEIRTPMNSIVGFSELAIYNDVPEKNKDYLVKIMENSQWLLQILNDILDISKIESGKMEVEALPLNLHDMFANCRSIILPKVLDKNLKLHFYAEPSMGKVPLGDPIKLRQVFLNLLSNAVKFTNTGIIKIQALVVSSTEDTVTMCFDVKDSGIGMEPEQVEKIFDPFTQAETGTTRKYGGTGLGLAITKNLVEIMGGKLAVESTFGVGSKFSFTLTFDTINSTDDIIYDNHSIPVELKKPTFKGEVLLCEDNAMNQQVIYEHLERVGIKAVIANNGKQAVELVRERTMKNQKPFDLIFMDIHMPIMDGLEATDKILEFNTDTPIVALTANIMSHDKELYLMRGMDGCVSKPFTTQELWACLMKYFKPINWKNEDELELARADEILRQKLIKNFVKNNTNFYEVFNNAINSNDIKLAHRMVHTLKSNAGQLRKVLLLQIAAEIEEVLKDDNNNISSQQLEKLRVELETVLNEFAPVANDYEKENSIEKIDKQAVMKLFEEIEPLIDDHDSSCLNFINNLKAIPGCQKLISEMENLDFEIALITLNDLKTSVGSIK